MSFGELPPGIQILQDTILTSFKALDSKRGGFVNYVFTVGAVNIKARPSQANRSYLSIQNQSTSPTGFIYLDFNINARVNRSLKINPGGYIEYDTIIPIDAINIVAQQEGVLVVITEGTPPITVS